MAPEFEKTHALIINIASYIKETDEKIIIFNKKQLMNAYEFMRCGYNKVGMPVSFINTWTTCNDIYENMITLKYFQIRNIAQQIYIISGDLLLWI